MLFDCNTSLKYTSPWFLKHFQRGPSRHGWISLEPESPNPAFPRFKITLLSYGQSKKGKTILVNAKSKLVIIEFQEIASSCPEKEFFAGGTASSGRKISVKHHNHHHHHSSSFILSSSSFSSSLSGPSTSHGVLFGSTTPATSTGAILSSSLSSLLGLTFPTTSTGDKSSFNLNTMKICRDFFLEKQNYSVYHRDGMR